MKKTFLITEFGAPFSWTDKYIQNCGQLEKYGFYWKIFTPNKYENVPANVEIVDMNTEQFCDLVEKKLEVRPNMYITDKGCPSVHITDFYVFSGAIFEDYLTDSDWWGITNMDVVYGRLDHFIPDSELEKYDIWTDDVNAINGVFSLWRNTPKVNKLFLVLADWKEIIGQPVCDKCCGQDVDNKGHSLYGSDEYHMTNVMKDPRILAEIRYGYPKYYPIHSYDRLETQVPDVKLEMKDDGSLWELSNDTRPPVWEHTHKHFGREVGYYHFGVTKKWPL